MHKHKHKHKHNPGPSPSPTQPHTRHPLALSLESNGAEGLEIDLAQLVDFIVLQFMRGRQ
jgi:hypothetical protein